jgi:hypothetical protein
MAKVDMNRMRRSYEENQRGGDIWNPPQGLTKVYVHPPCREDDTHELTKGTNYIALVVHYGLGKDNGMGVCLNPDRNPILGHPFIQAALKKRKIKLTGKCAVCSGISSGALSSEEAEEAKPNTRFLFGVTPVMQKMSKTSEWQKLTPKPQVMLTGSTVYNGIMDVFMENDDITDMSAAVFVIIGREGAKKFDTKYTVKVDPDTLKKPKALPDPVRKLLLKAMMPEGDCDLFRIVSNMIKSPEELKTLLAGGKPKTGSGRSRSEESEDSDWDGDSEDSDDDTSDDSELEDGDTDSDGDGELEDGDGDDDTEASDDSDDDSSDDEASDDSDDDTEASDDDGELEDGDGDSDDSDDDTSSDDDTGSDDDDSSDDSDDEPEPEPVKPKKPAPGKPAKPEAKPSKPAKPAAKDDDDLGLDELDAELEAIASKKGKPEAKPAGKPAPGKPGKPGKK